MDKGLTSMTASSLDIGSLQFGFLKLRENGFTLVHCGLGGLNKFAGEAPRDRCVSQKSIGPVLDGQIGMFSSAHLFVQRTRQKASDSEELIFVGFAPVVPRYRGAYHVCIRVYIQRVGELTEFVSYFIGFRHFI